VFSTTANELHQRIRSRGSATGSGAFYMYVDAILSCTLVIRHPQLITRASNICEQETALYIQTYCNLSCSALIPDYVASLMNFFNSRATQKCKNILSGKIFKSTFTYISLTKTNNYVMLKILLSLQSLFIILYYYFLLNYY